VRCQLQIEKVWAVPLRKAYSVAHVKTPTGLAIFAGSEERESIVLIERLHSPVVRPIGEHIGGVMQIMPWPGCKLKLVAIAGFYPPFQAEGTRIVALFPRDHEKDKQPWACQTMAEVPFAHRIGFVTSGQWTWLVVSTVATAKDNPEDWSKPGAVWVLTIASPYETRGGAIRKVLDGIHKNHGLQVRDGKEVYVSGKEGLFRLVPPSDGLGEWKHWCLIDREISDFCFGDIDGDGREEVVTIEPFHGDHIVVYKCLDGQWIPIDDQPAHFGHVVWCGNWNTKPTVVVGNRGGTAELAVMRFDTSSGRLKTMAIIEEGVGPAQISVFNEGTSYYLVAANNGADEVSLYRVIDF